MSCSLVQGAFCVLSLVQECDRIVVDVVEGERREGLCPLSVLVYICVLHCFPPRYETETVSWFNNIMFHSHTF